MSQEDAPITQAQCFTHNEETVHKSTSETAQDDLAYNADGAHSTEVTQKECFRTETSSDPFPSEAEIKEALREVYDPELGVNVVDLGLIYDIDLNKEARSVHINMTLTSPGCPLGPEMTSSAYLAITRLKGVKECNIDLVWTPAWDPETKLTEEARAALGLW